MSVGVSWHNWQNAGGGCYLTAAWLNWHDLTHCTRPSQLISPTVDHISFTLFYHWEVKQRLYPKKGLLSGLPAPSFFHIAGEPQLWMVQVPPDWRQCFLINLKISIPKSDPRWEPASVNCWGLRSSPSGPSQERPSQRSSRAGASPSLPFRTSSWCHLHPMSETAQT